MYFESLHGGRKRQVGVSHKERGRVPGADGSYGPFRRLHSVRASLALYG